MLDVTGSWKGKLWAVFFLWPLIGIGLIEEYWNDPSQYKLLINVGIALGWLLWCFFLYKFIKLISTEFKNTEE